MYTLLGSATARVHPKCANAHKCFGMTLGRRWNSEVWNSGLDKSKYPKKDWLIIFSFALKWSVI